MDVEVDGEHSTAHIVYTLNCNMHSKLLRQGNISYREGSCLPHRYISANTKGLKWSAKSMLYDIVFAVDHDSHRRWKESFYEYPDEMKKLLYSRSGSSIKAGKKYKELIIKALNTKNIKVSKDGKDGFHYEKQENKILITNKNACNS